MNLHADIMFQPTRAPRGARDTIRASRSRSSQKPPLRANPLAVVWGIERDRLTNLVYLNQIKHLRTARTSARSSDAWGSRGVLIIGPAVRRSQWL